MWFEETILWTVDGVYKRKVAGSRVIFQKCLIPHLQRLGCVLRGGIPRRASGPEGLLLGWASTDGGLLAASLCQIWMLSHPLPFDRPIYTADDTMIRNVCYCMLIFQCNFLVIHLPTSCCFTGTPAIGSCPLCPCTFSHRKSWQT